MSADMLIAAGTVAGSITAIGGVAAWVAKLVRAPLEGVVARLGDKLTDLHDDVTHNRANADMKFQALDNRLSKHSDDIVALSKADIEHTVAIRHIEETLRHGLAGIERRLDEDRAERAKQFDQLCESIREVRTVGPK